MKLYELDLSESQLLDIKRLLAKYFVDAASAEMDKLRDENGWSYETMDEWLSDDAKANPQ